MTTPAEDYLLVGRIAAPFGVRGQVKVRSFTDRPDHLLRCVRTLYIGSDYTPYQITHGFEHKPGLLVLTIKTITTREDAVAMRNREVYIRAQDAAPLAEGEYFLHDLYGMRVETESGDLIGTVREVLETGANEVLVVQREGQPDALIPVIHDVVVNLDYAAKRITIRVLEGLL